MITLTPHLTSVFDRAGMSAEDPQLLSAMESVLRQAGADPDHVLEVSRARVGSDYEPIEDVLVVLTRTGVVLVPERRRTLFARAEPLLIVKPFAEYDDVMADDDAVGPSVFFLSRDERKVFALMWSGAAERDRMYMPIFWAHAGRFEHWGLMLETAAYADDFDRFYDEIAANAPPSEEGVRAWIAEKYGEFDLSNALGFAREWRSCELRDERNGNVSDRIMRVSFPYPWVDVAPGAREILVRLGEPLFDQGALGPPYDEPTFNVDDELSSMDAGPQRLIALMTLAGNANAIGHPRATELVAAAREGMSAVPPDVFGSQLHELWSGLGGLPIDSTKQKRADGIP
jgi:hypothetical protein